MLKNFLFIKTKVAVGYALLLLVLLSSFYFIYQEFGKLTASEEYENELSLKRKAINNTLSCLYQAESIGQSLSTGRLEDYPLYEKSMKELLASVDSLKKFSSDSLQSLRIDSIFLLLQQKEMNTISLLKTMNSAKNDKLYHQNIEKVLRQHDSLLKQQKVQRRLIMKQDSLLSKRNKKTIFKRIAEVFAPEKDESTKILKTSRELLSDTLLQAYNPADTVAGMFHDIQREIKGKQKKIEDLMTSKTSRLRENSLVLNGKINQLIRNFEQEEVNSSLDKLELQKNIKQRSMRIIIGIAGISVMLAACFLIIIWRDLTNSNLYRHELEIARQRAEDLLRSREKMMLTITHDFKAPLGSIMGYTDLLSRLTTQERQMFYLNNMKSSSEHLLRLVNDLLDFHRLESNKMELNQIPFNPVQLFNEIKTSFDPLAEKKGLIFHYEVDSALNGNFSGDPLRIRQIANNLLSNALKFTPKGSITLAITLDEPIFRLVVSDTGKGMSEEDQKKIFEEFTRLRSAQGEEGFGLGLSIAQKLVELLKGTIEVTSNEGRGSTFTVRLPIQRTVNTGNTHSEPSPASSTLKLKTIPLLLIDDDRIQLELTAAMLKQQGISAICCQYPEELFEWLKKETFTLLLTDVQMPAINGFELLKQLRESDNPQAQNIPIIAITARSDMDEQEFIRKGFTACLHKPFSITQLLAVISGLPASKVKEEFQVSDNERLLSSKIDFSALTALSEGDAKASATILTTFVKETNKNRDALRKALQSADMNAISALCHKLLPLFTLIHATDCLPPLFWLEAHRDKDFSEEVNEKTTFVLQEIETILVDAEKLLN